MNREQHNGQLSVAEFHLPFGGTLDPEIRWVLLYGLMRSEGVTPNHSNESPISPLRGSIRSCLV